MKSSKHFCTKIFKISIFLLFFIVQAGNGFAQKIEVDASIIENKVPKYLFGSCIEDVNHEIYGGLYDQKIFGESFEEPANYSFIGMSVYAGEWELKDSVLSVKRSDGAKVIFDNSEIGNGTAEVKVKFTGEGENGGIVFHVSESGIGADNFIGYEISLLQHDQKIRLGKHVHNYTLLREVPAVYNIQDWTLLKVNMEGSRIRVYINNSETPAMDYTDNNNPILTGKCGLRTWNADLDFKKAIVSSSTGTDSIDFKVTSSNFVSKMWDVVKSTNDSVIFNLEQENAFNGINCQTINYISGTENAGIINRSLNRWGIAVEDNQVFQGRVYLRSSDYKGKVIVGLQNADGTETYATDTLKNLSESWQKHSFSLACNKTDANSRFVILMNEPGKIYIDQAVLMQTGEKQFKGLPYRADIGNMLVNEGLNFLRYGGTMVNSSEYRFKKMIGDRDQRPPYKGHWYKYSTNGFGIEDFVAFCEAAKFTCSFAVNIEETGEDMADMIDYFNGDITTVWGKKRAENGHPEPYNIKYLEIGNEEVLFNGDVYAEYMHYIDRFNEIYDAVSAKDSSIKFICSAWWRPESPNVKLVFNALNGKADYWDYHPWTDALNSGSIIDNELKRMQNLFKIWDPKTNMKCALFEENGNTHNIQRAIVHAATLNAVRRNGDFMLTSCPANCLQPYQQNDNGWDQGQIFFTPSQVWGQPTYYAQKMASQNHLPLLVKSSNNAQLDISATTNENCDTVILHVVNTSGNLKSVSMHIKGMKMNYGEVKIYTLKGSLNGENLPDSPEKYKTTESSIEAKIDSLEYSFPPYSYTILKFAPTSFTGLNTNTKLNNEIIYPNPTDKFINIKCSENSKVEIINIEGKIVLSKIIDYTGTIDLSELQLGIYFVRFNNKSETKQFKIFKI
ncbi:MAG: T9SS type A sorting domain-containing protein [Salinivirgaceae bacterium]|jgi:alpha-L-arabinofuranosidase|nr:T9SS type A sorting domain-containing protein [Salinivirgaceae bacterium]